MNRQHPKPRTPIRIVAITLASAVLLGGCTGNDMSDLRQWVDEVKQRPGGRIDPIPEMKPATTYIYEAFERRNPFEPPVDPRAEQNDSGISPDTDRPKEELERFPLDALAMRGIIERPDLLLALVRDGDGVIHEVTVGNYMGQNYGRIESITETEITLIEIVPDGQGGWREQPASVKLRADR